MKKIVITGSNGLLGQTLLNLLMKDLDSYRVYGLSRGKNRTGRDDFSYHSMDITNYNQLKDCLYAIKPDFIVNTAAMTNVDLCEEQKEVCHQINIDAVENLSKICSKIHSHLIQISTDFIFDGVKGNYKESDMPNPLSIYGKSKLKSEEVLLNSSIQFTILRTILVYGKVNNLGRNNIVLWVQEMLEKKKEINMVYDQYRMPTYVEDLAMACKISIDKGVNGIFNISSNQLLSIFQIAQQVAEVFGLQKELIVPISTETLDQKALRPPKTGFNLSKTNKELGLHTKSFKEDLQRFKESLS
ncbi:MAG: dTDP-4-dehydrorhamnose reductase [Flavobacterium sp. SCGC AAA160-P02]|nr:MAG: dTDP-4-dehydrorhamnose reductase [Flavobacterium sp. SCGC AAA160-P02]